MECGPTARAVVVKVADPKLRELVASGVPPSWKTTKPVGVPAPGNTAATVAVKVTDWPKTEGVSEVVTVVAVSAWLAVCVTTPEVLVLKLRSPLYRAVSEWEPAESEVLVKETWPAERGRVSSVEAPSFNVTVPVGVPT